MQVASHGAPDQTPTQRSLHSPRLLLSLNLNVTPPAHPNRTPHSTPTATFPTSDIPKIPRTPAGTTPHPPPTPAAAPSIPPPPPSMPTFPLPLPVPEPVVVRMLPLRRSTRHEGVVLPYHCCAVERGWGCAGCWMQFPCSFWGRGGLVVCQVGA